MTNYIDLDFQQRTLNGKQTTVDTLTDTLQDVRQQPSRYLCLFRNDYTGKFKYADFENHDSSDGDGDVVDND